MTTGNQSIGWLIAGIFFIICSFVNYPTNEPDAGVHVNGYYRQDGTYVNSYNRTYPDDTTENNLSTYRNHIVSSWFWGLIGLALCCFYLFSSPTTSPNKPTSHIQKTELIFVESKPSEPPLRANTGNGLEGLWEFVIGFVALLSIMGAVIAIMFLGLLILLKLWWLLIILFLGFLLYLWNEDHTKDEKVKAIINGMGYSWTVALDTAQQIAYPYPLTELLSKKEIDKFIDLSASSDFIDGKWSKMLNNVRDQKRLRIANGAPLN